MHETKTILVAPLNWGLGHATRSIPIIKSLKEEGFNVVIGSDGAALALLQKEFPYDSFIELPSYKIEYAKKGKNFKFKFLVRSPKLISAVRNEHAVITKLYKEGKIDGIISDNRLGLYCPGIPTVFITHQLQVLSGTTTKITSAIHNRYIKRFNECWVPDYAGELNLSGVLGHPKKPGFSVKYIGPLSRLEKIESTTPKENYDIMVLLSGPEPQRTELEEILLYELKPYNGRVLFVRGIISDDQAIPSTNNIKIVNYMNSENLERAFSSSNLIISRSGYTTVMDLLKLGKKAFFIPTPGQTEQEYLAKRLMEQRLVPYTKQEDFKLKDLSKVKIYKGLDSLIGISGFEEIQFGKLFGLFKGERKLRTHPKVTFNINLFIMSFNNMLNDRKTKS